MEEKSKKFKGFGLVAIEEIKVGELVLKEEPLIIYSWDIFASEEDFKAYLEALPRETIDKIVDLKLNDTDANYMLHTFIE